MKRIESKDNSTYRYWRELRQTRKGRSRKQVFLEGYRLCVDVLASGVNAAAALVSDTALQSAAGAGFLEKVPAGTERYALPDKLFGGLCTTQNPQGFALICEAPLLEQPDIPPVADGLYLIAEDIRDPGNLGNMIRTADAFDFDAILLTTGTVYPFNDKVLRSAMGSCFHIPLIQMPDLDAIASWLSSGSTRVALLAADPREGEMGGTSGAQAWPGHWPVPAALVIGNEAFGLSEAARHLCSDRIAIPMPGRAESLNAAAAAAILCFQLMLARQSVRAGLHSIRTR